MDKPTVSHNPAGGAADHRSETAHRRRELMRARIVAATVRVFAGGGTPVIEDVVREAKISRGAFYKYFDSLDEARRAAGVALSDDMVASILPVYDCLKEPWQRAAVGFRVFLLRALQDPKWAGFLTRMDAWPHGALNASYMSADMRRGRELGQFRFDDVDVTTDFIMGASAAGIYALRGGVADPEAYTDASVRMLLQALGCTPQLQDMAVAFSRDHLKDWASGASAPWKTIASEG